MALLERLAILITADAAGAVGEMKKLASEADKNIGSVEGKASGFAGAMTKVGAGMMAAGAGVMAVGISSANGTVALGREVMKLERLTGMNSEAASRLRGSAKLAGTDVDALAVGLVKLSKAAENNSPTFDELGIKTRDASGNLRPMADLLPEVADKFKNMPNGIEKTAKATELFGRSGADLLPFLNRGSEGLKELADKADKMGLTLSEKNVGQIKKYITAQRELNASIDGVKNQIGLAMIPILTGLTDAFSGLPGPVTDVIGPLTIFGGAGLIALGSIGMLVGAIGNIAPAIGGMISSMVGAAQGLGTMVIVGGPVLWTILGIAAAVALAAAAFAIFGKDSTINTEAVNGYTEALRLGGVAALQAANATTIQGFAEDGTADALKRSSVAQHTLNAVIADGGTGLKDYVESVRKWGVSSNQAGAIYDTLTDSQKSYVNQLYAAKVAEEITEDEYKKLISSLGDLAQSHGIAADKTEASGTAAEVVAPKVTTLAAAEQAAADATDKHKEAADELNAALRGALDPFFAMTSAAQKNEESQLRAVTAANDMATAYLDLVAAQATGDPKKIADATQNLTDKQTAYNEAQRAAVDSAVTYQTSLNTLKAGIEDGSIKLDEAIGKVNQMEKDQKISAETAVYWRTKLNEAADTAAGRSGTALVLPVLTPGLDEALTKMRAILGLTTGDKITLEDLYAYSGQTPAPGSGEYVTGFDGKRYPVNGNASGGRLPGFAAGGRPSSPSLVGELGPEIFWPDSAGTIIAADRSRQMLTAGSGGGTNVTNVSITVTSMNPDDVIKAIRKYERSNGKQWATA